MSTFTPAAAASNSSHLVPKQSWWRRLFGLTLKLPMKKLTLVEKNALAKRRKEARLALQVLDLEQIVLKSMVSDAERGWTSGHYNSLSNPRLSLNVLHDVHERLRLRGLEVSLKRYTISYTFNTDFLNRLEQIMNGE